MWRSGIRVEVNPTQLNHYGLDLEDIRTTLADANNNRPKGYLEQHGKVHQIQTNDQLTQAADYLPLIVRHQNGAAIRLSDVAKVEDSVSNSLNMGLLNNEPDIMLVITVLSVNFIGDGVRACRRKVRRPSK